MPQLDQRGSGGGKPLPGATPSGPPKAPEPGQNPNGFFDIGGSIRGARTDDELFQAVHHRKNDTVLVQYGSSWCIKCKRLLPTFLQLTSQFKDVDYVVASVDHMQEAVRDIRHSPHFCFFKGGRRVDEFEGDCPQRLRDRLWLHHPRSETP